MYLWLEFFFSFSHCYYVSPPVQYFLVQKKHLHTRFFSVFDVCWIVDFLICFTVAWFYVDRNKYTLTLTHSLTQAYAYTFVYSTRIHASLKTSFVRISWNELIAIQTWIVSLYFILRNLLVFLNWTCVVSLTASNSF